MQTNAEPEAVRRTSYSRVERSDVTARRIVLAAAVVLGLAVLKPWSLVGQARDGDPGVPLAASVASPRGSAPSPAVEAAAAPDTPAAGADADHIACFHSSEWLLVTLEHNGPNTVKSWYVVDAAPSLVGLPPPHAIPLRVVAGNLIGIGLCPPASGAIPNVPLAGAWLASPSGGPAKPLAGLPAVAPPQLGLAILYGHPKQAIADDAAWPSGRYVFEAVDPRLNPDRVVWISVTIVSGGNHRG